MTVLREYGNLKVDDLPTALGLKNPILNFLNCLGIRVLLLYKPLSCTKSMYSILLDTRIYLISREHLPITRERGKPCVLFVSTPSTHLLPYSSQMNWLGGPLSLANLMNIERHNAYANPLISKSV